MPTADTQQDPLLRLADELRELSAKLAGVADALRLRTTLPTTTAPVPIASTPAPPTPTPTAARSRPAQPGPQPHPTLPQPIPARPATNQPRPLSPPATQAYPGPGPASWPPVWQWPVDAQAMSELPTQLPPVPQPPADRRASATWDWLGSRSLAWIGGAVTLLGVVLLLVLAIQQGWLGPMPRLLCGLGFAAGLLAVGWWVRRTPSGLIGGFALTATGIAALYLDVVAATALYTYLPVAVGLFAGLVIAVAGLWLASRWNSLTLAIFVVLAAAACAPIITHGVTALMVAFLLVLAWAATPVQLRRHWRWLAVAADVPPLAASLVLDQFTVGATGSTVTATAVVAMVTVLACLGLAGMTVLRGDDDPLALGLLIAAPTPVMAAAPLLTRPWAITSLAIVSALLFAIWAANLLRRTPRLPARFAAAAGAAGAVTLFQASAMATADNTGVFTITVLGQAILIAMTAYRIRGLGTLIAAGAYATVGLVTAVAGSVHVTLLVRVPVGQLDTGPLRSALVISALLTVAVLVIAASVMRLGRGHPGIWWPLGIIGLYGFSGTVLCASMLVAPDQQGFLIGQVLVTVGWAACALLLLVKGIEAVPARMAGLALVAGALLKLIVFDLSTLGGVERVAAFLGSGIVLLAAGVRYARALSARRNAE